MTVPIPRRGRCGNCISNARARSLARSEVAHALAAHGRSRPLRFARRRRAAAGRRGFRRRTRKISARARRLRLAHRARSRRRAIVSTHGSTRRAYTGRPPILLTPGSTGRAAQTRRVQAPAGSNIVVRRLGERGRDDAKSKAACRLPRPTRPPRRKAGRASARDRRLRDTEQRCVLRGDGKLRLKRGASTLATFDIASVPDRPPTISLRGEPKSQHARRPDARLQGRGRLRDHRRGGAISPSR